MRVFAMNLVKQKSAFMELQNGESMCGFIIPVFILVVEPLILMSIAAPIT
jgi:hypothetical protein